MFGAILALLAAASLSLSVADVVLTVQAYCTPWSNASSVWCSMTAEPYIWTWVGSGIWGSLPIFFAGVFSMCLSRNPYSWTRIFALLMFLSSLVFAPAILVLTSIELWRGGSSAYTFYSMSNSAMSPGSIMPPGQNPYQAKFAIPLVVAILAGIMLLMTGIVTLNLCCCMQNLGIYLQPDVAPAPAPVVVEQRAPPPPQIANQVVEYQANYGFPNSGFSSQAVMPTRYTPYGGSGVMYGNFPSKAQGPNMSASDFFNSPNPSYFWK